MDRNNKSTTIISKGSSKKHKSIDEGFIFLNRGFFITMCCSIVPILFSIGYFFGEQYGYPITTRNANYLESVPKQLNNENIYSWDTLEVGIENLTNQVKQSLYKPTLLVGIGRGGAVMSALLSGTLGDRPPFIALEREYDWKEKKRTAKIFDDVKFSKNLDRVLLVAGDVVTGGTADLFTEYLKKLGAKEIRLLTFLKVKSTTKIPDFFYIDSNSSDFTLPWMLNEDYLRDSREIYKLK